MKKFHILTIFPEVIDPYATASIMGRAQQKKLAKITAHNLRDFTLDKHRKVDATPYGGGAGMVMTVQPFDAAVKKIKTAAKKKSVRVVLTAASGNRFTEADAHRLLAYDEVIFLCGRYEGVDHRVFTSIADEAISIGDFVLTGGELPALVITDAIVRLIPGVLGNAETLAEESHDTEGFLEYPQYTKPEVYLMKQGRKSIELPVPRVLLSGNHAEIKKWRSEQVRKGA
jgi:tRNA (guanine37-N1)-methyltransferase